MTCRQAEPLLARAADGTLDADRRAALALHVVACADCREALNAQHATRELLAARPDTPVPPGFATRVMANLAERDAGRVPGWLEAVNWQAWTLRLAPVAAALFVGAAIGLVPSSEVAEEGAVDYVDVVSEWMVEETADGEVPDAAEVDTVARLWQDAEETTDDLLIDVLLATDPDGTLSGANEAER